MRVLKITDTENNSLYFRFASKAREHIIWLTENAKFLAAEVVKIKALKYAHNTTEGHRGEGDSLLELQRIEQEQFKNQPKQFKTIEDSYEIIDALGESTDLSYEEALHKAQTEQGKTFDKEDYEQAQRMAIIA